MAVAIMAVGVAVSAAGAIMNGMAQAQQMDAQAKAAEYNAQVANNNAIIARQNQQIQQERAARERDIVQEQATFNAEKQRRQNRKLAGAQRAAYAASGINLTGTAADVMSDSATQGELDALTYRYQANLSNWNSKYESSIQNFNSNVEVNRNQAQSQLFLMEANSARKAKGMAMVNGFIGAAGAVASGAGSIMSNPISSAGQVKPAFPTQKGLF